MKIVSIQKGKYDEYRLDAIFDGYKWDPQFYDKNTIAGHVLVITKKEADEIFSLTKKLSAETIEAENFLNNNLKIAKALLLPKKIKPHLKKMSNYKPERNLRLMRFDFHPVVGGGYAVSEVNSDVPGGFAESSVLPKIAINYLGKQKYRYINFGDILVNGIQTKVKAGGKIAIVHCTSYSDDRQVMQFLGDKLEILGYKVQYIAGDHLKFENKKAISVLYENFGEVDFVFRYTPLEWLAAMKKQKAWHGYFDTVTPSCNHPVSMFAQTKRLPLIFAKLQKYGIDLSAWRALLPETLEVKDAKNKEGFIFKPACGRVGEGISIKEACKKDEYQKILKDVKKHPKQYIAQKMFISQPLTTPEGDCCHLCLGSYSVEGKPAGFYARISRTRRIDSFAEDLPVIIET